MERRKNRYAEKRIERINGMIAKMQSGAVVSRYGQWKYPGMTTVVPSSNITMKGVPYPVLGVSDNGDAKMMLPGMDYQFNGNSVTEYPVMQTSGTAYSLGGEYDLTPYEMETLRRQGYEFEEISKHQSNPDPFANVTVDSLMRAAEQDRNARIGQTAVQPVDNTRVDNTGVSYKDEKTRRQIKEAENDYVINALEHDVTPQSVIDMQADKQANQWLLNPQNSFIGGTMPQNSRDFHSGDDLTQTQREAGKQDAENMLKIFGYAAMPEFIPFAVAEAMASTTPDTKDDNFVEAASWLYPFGGFVKKGVDKAINQSAGILGKQFKKGLSRIPMYFNVPREGKKITANHIIKYPFFGKDDRNIRIKATFDEFYNELSNTNKQEIDDLLKYLDEDTIYRFKKSLSKDNFNELHNILNGNNLRISSPKPDDRASSFLGSTELLYNPKSEALLQDVLHEGEHIRRGLLKEWFDNKEIKNFNGFTEKEANLLGKAYPISKKAFEGINNDYNDLILETGAINSELRRLVSRDKNVVTTQLDDVIENLSNEEILNYLEEIDKYTQKEVSKTIKESGKIDEYIKKIKQAMKEIAYHPNNNFENYA